MLLIIVIVSSLTMIVSADSGPVVGDPSGANTGSIADVTAANPGHPTLDEIGTQVGKNKIGINYVWVLLCGMLIFFFQAGADGTYGDGFNGIAGGVRGLFYGDPGQLWAQLINVGVLIVWGFGLSYVFFKLLHKTVGIRVSAQDEIAGLDMPEMGILAYPDFVLSNSETSLFMNEGSSLSNKNNLIL